MSVYNKTGWISRDTVKGDKVCFDSDEDTDGEQVTEVYNRKRTYSPRETDEENDLFEEYKEIIDLTKEDDDIRTCVFIPVSNTFGNSYVIDLTNDKEEKLMEIAMSRPYPRRVKVIVTESTVTSIESEWDIHNLEEGMFFDPESVFDDVVPEQYVMLEKSYAEMYDECQSFEKLFSNCDFDNDFIIDDDMNLCYQEPEKTSLKPKSMTKSCFYRRQYRKKN
jgi:hypothetical protein